MKKIFLILIISIFPAASLMAQDNSAQGGPVLDSTILGQNIFKLLPSKERGGKADVLVNQSAKISSLLENHIASNSSRNAVCYRVRIFNDNAQTARNASESVLAGFKVSHPGIPAYRSYSNPFFKVTVGDFRSKSEALGLLYSLISEYPTAFIVKENVKFPWMGARESYVPQEETIVRR